MQQATWMFWYLVKSKCQNIYNVAINFTDKQILRKQDWHTNVRHFVLLDKPLSLICKLSSFTSLQIIEHTQSNTFTVALNSFHSVMILHVSWSTDFLFPKKYFIWLWWLVACNTILFTIKDIQLLYPCFIWHQPNWETTNV